MSGVKRHFLVYPELPGDPRLQLRQRLRAERRPARRSRDGRPPKVRPKAPTKTPARNAMNPDLLALEDALRERLAGTLPGLDAQLRFMPTPPRTGWKPGEFPSDARIAAGLLLLYPGDARTLDSADRARERPAPPRRTDQPARRRHRSRRDAGAGGAARSARGDRRRSRARPHPRRADAGPRPRQRLHAPSRSSASPTSGPSSRSPRTKSKR